MPFCNFFSSLTKLRRKKLSQREENTVVSSAKEMKLRVVGDLKMAIDIGLKRRGPWTEPWGTLGKDR